MWRTTQSCDDIESLDGILNEPPMYEEETLVPPVTNEIDHPNVDYESNGVIWVPPPPEDEDEDDAEMSLVNCSKNCVLIVRNGCEVSCM